MRRITTLAAAAATILGAQAAAQSGYGSVGATVNEGFDDVGLTGRVGADLAQYFAIEGEGNYFFDSEVGYFGGYGVGKFPASEQITLLGRLGYGVLTNFDGGSEDGFAYGVGAEFAVNPRGAVRADYTRLDFGDGTDEGFLSVSYVFRFGGAQ